MIKSIISKKPKPAREYPYLGKCRQKNFIVLFSEYKTGIVVWSEDKGRIGYHSEYWTENLFTQFHGNITLKNEDSK